MKENAEVVFQQIISIGTSEDASKHRKPVFAPGFKSLEALCELLAEEPQEEALHQFLVQEPAFLFSLFGTNDDGDLAIISKPKIGIRLVADFALLKFSQGGCVIDLIELERSSLRLFNKNGHPSAAFSHAICQVDDWRAHIERNAATFVRETLETAKRLPIYSKLGAPRTGFRLRSAPEIQRLWTAFSGYERTIFRYSIIMGRWAVISDSERSRLIDYNLKYQELHSVFTYDQLARQALARPNIDEW